MENRNLQSGAAGSPPAAEASPSNGHPTDGNPSTSTPATVPGAYWFYQIGEELRNLLTANSITPDDSDLTQVHAAITKMMTDAQKSVIVDSATFEGTVADGDAVYYDAGNTRFAKAIADGTNKQDCVGLADVTNSQVVRFGRANALLSGLTPGAQYYLDASTAGALTTTAPANVVRVGIAISATLMHVDVDEPGASDKSEIMSITGTVASNALTAGLQPTTLAFRNSTLSNGAPSEVVISSALSLTVPSGATLGTVDTIQSRIMLLAINNAGTVELAVVNEAGGVNLDETTLISTTAIDATADSDNVIYSDTARTNVPFRVVGYIESTQAVAGTWATSPSKLQGAGGNAITALHSIGRGQTWQDVSGSRSASTTYYNTTGKPIFVYIAGDNAGGGSHTLTIGGVTSNMNGVASCDTVLYGIVPPGAAYSCTLAERWNELR